MHIWILEDEDLLAANISKKLSRHWFEVSVFHTLHDFYQSNFKQINLFIIDITLWEESWFDAIKWLREKQKNFTPIIITSGYNDVDNKIFWLHIWADDYLEKPFEPEELLARIKALLRRSFEFINQNELSYKDFLYNVEYKKLTYLWKEIELTKKEYEIVEYFFIHQWKIISKNTLTEVIWWNNSNTMIWDNTINVTLSRLRKKLWNDFELSTIVWLWYSLKK